MTVGGREVVTAAVGDSMANVPATTDMRFRVGSVGIAYMNVVLLQLVDKGVVTLDEPISRWFPSLRQADKVTLRMLGSTTSGYPDFESYPTFVKRLYADPFQHWTEQELIDLALERPSWYQPGKNWSYSHANFVILGRILERVTRTPLEKLLRRNVMNPLGLSATVSETDAPIPGPVLHSYTIERGFFEDATYWNPSWSTADGAVLTSNICDLAVSARAIGTGRLISAKSFRELLNPGTVGIGGPTKDCPATICVPQTAGAPLRARRHRPGRLDPAEAVVGRVLRRPDLLARQGHRHRCRHHPRAYDHGGELRPVIAARIGDLLTRNRA